jgi:hypothetical protein
MEHSPLVWAAAAFKAALRVIQIILTMSEFATMRDMWHVE